MEDLLEKGERLLDVIDNALRSGDWKTDGSCDPTPAVESFRAELFSTYMTYIINAATKPSEISTESERWAAFDFHLAKAIRAIRSRGDASDISQELSMKPQKVNIRFVMRYQTGNPAWFFQHQSVNGVG
jgi:hypothetical protein